MTERITQCKCGELTMTTRAEPLRVSVCYACQRRTGSAFGVQSWFGIGTVEIRDDSQEYVPSDKDFPPPDVSVYDQSRRHRWVTLPDDMARVG